ncbi:MAG: hypothetical protein KC912_24355 [Proteobacteria bacterium]|nr:hypothetical protein [Pseudomonadota bacterium]
MLAGLLAGTGCNLFGGGSPISGPPEVPWTTRADIDGDTPTRYEVDNEVLLNALVDGVDEPTRYEVDNEVLLNDPL